MYKHQLQGVEYSRQVSSLTSHFVLRKMTAPEPVSVQSLQSFSHPCCGHSPCSLLAPPQGTLEYPRATGRGINWGLVTWRISQINPEGLSQLESFLIYLFSLQPNSCPRVEFESHWVSFCPSCPQHWIVSTLAQEFCPRFMSFLVPRSVGVSLGCPSVTCEDFNYTNPGPVHRECELESLGLVLQNARIRVQMKSRHLVNMKAKL